MNSLAGKRVLIIDALATSRVPLQKAFESFGFERPHAVVDFKDAVWHLESNNYSIIVCDYDLGEGTDGQQLLEYLRTRDLISRNTIFIMATAESAYEKVVTVAECAPDDYLLKPFSTEQLYARLKRLLDRQTQFAAIDLAADRKDWPRVIVECDTLIAQQDKLPYLIEANRIKGAALLKALRPQEAETVYKSVQELRPSPWAKLGLARAMAMQGDKLGAIALAQEVIDEHAHYLAAYDFLAEELTETGEKKAALEILQTARRVSPGTMDRIRHVADLAVDTGRHDIAERILTEALNRHQHSPVIEAQDYAKLSRILTEEGRSDKALSIIAHAKPIFEDDVSKVVLATSECLAYRRSGHLERAEKVLAEALAADQGQLPPSAAAAVAEACLALGQAERGANLLKQVVQNNPDDIKTQALVRAVLAASGANEEEAAAMVASSVQEIIQLNNEGVRKAEAGNLEEAVNLLCDAADRLPNNLQVVSNAALALALDMQRHGFTSIKMHECLHYREMVVAKSPSHPKLAQIDTVLDQIRRP
jgi:DNA-binding response OmpR family regulator